MLKKTYARCSPFSFLSSQLNDTGVSDTATALADLAALVDVVDLADLAGVVVVGAQKVPCAQTAVVVSVLQLAADAVVVAAFHFRARLVLVWTILAVNAAKRSHRKECASGHACGPAAASVNLPSLSSSPWNPNLCVMAIITVIADHAATRNRVDHFHFR